jgi:hypothetical protein
MSQMDNARQSDHRPRQRIAALAAILCLGLLAASPAAANYEQVGNFAGTPGVLHGPNPSEWPEEVQLGGTSGMAVNHTGVGGVPKGTLYAATNRVGDGRVLVARYNPDGSFSESWTLEGPLGGAPKERCGPDGDPAHPNCASQPNAGAGGIDVEVDQTTGYVYALGLTESGFGQALIHVYTPDGSKLLAEFGVRGHGVGEPTATSPEKIHGLTTAGGIAVDAAGDVFVADRNGEEDYFRLMHFEPQSPGDYEHYVYAGQEADVAAGFSSEGKTIEAASATTDAAGNLYALGRDRSRIAEFDPGEPKAPPLCQFSFPKGSIDSFTVNPATGEVFFFTETDHKVHLLEPCKEGKFAEAGKFAIAPNRAEISALAFDPERQFGPGRPKGTLYAAAPSYEGGNSGGEGFESSIGYVFARPVVELPPEVLSESASHISATTAQLAARINPKSLATRYAFQYETEAAYEAGEPADRFAGAAQSPPGGAFLGEGTEALGAGASLSGLEPDTAYRYRVVATSHCSVEDPAKVCEATGPAQGFRTYPAEAPGLPDRRAYELVSPAQKEGGQVLPAEPHSYRCESFASCKPGALAEHFPMQSTPEGEAIAYEGTAFASGEGTVRANEYIANRNDKTGWQTTNLTPAQSGGYAAFDTALSRGILLGGATALSPEAPSGYANLYAQPSADPLSLSALLRAEPRNRPARDFAMRYAGASADLSRVFFEANDALTEETPFAPEALDGGAAKFNLYEWHEGQLALVNVLPGNTETEPGASFGPASAHAFSRDGSHVFFEDEAHQVYVRVNGEGTRAISTEGTPDPARFLAASTDANRVLLANGHLHSLGDEEPTIDLSEGKGGFQGVVGESEDLSRLYFVDTAVLSGEEENEYGARAEAGKFNLYAWAEGQGTRFVATLLVLARYTDEGDWHAPHSRTAEASPEGRYLSFLSRAPLSGYDNTGPCDLIPETAGEAAKYISGPCAEVFLYDSATGSLSCPSCNRSGQAPIGPSALRLINRGTKPSIPQPRYLTDEGRLYFDSADSLVPADTNEGYEDVYEYEPKGAGKAGTCEREAGCLSLVSAGSEPSDSNLLTIDEGAANVFFTSRDQLVLKDTDDLIDLYDAREEGGIPGESEASRGECQGEACQPLASPPNHPTPATSALAGDGNVHEEAKAKKHRHKKRGHAKKHRRAAKHNRGGSR